MYSVTVQKTFVDSDGVEVVYAYTFEDEDERVAVMNARMYASMVEYGFELRKWRPEDLAFPKEQLYQFIQPAVLRQLENIYPDVVRTGYASAKAYVQSYIGAMFDIDAMLEEGDPLSLHSLRLALCVSTAIFVLSSTPQYSDVVKQLGEHLTLMLRGLKSGHRNMGKETIPGDPNVRCSAVSLGKNGKRP